MHRCVEMLIKEQMRKYKMKMEEINHLEAAESIAFRRLSLLRQNAVSAGLRAGSPTAGLDHGVWPWGMVLPPETWKCAVWSRALWHRQDRALPSPKGYQSARYRLPL